MVERFVESAGTISVANGGSTVTGTGTTFSGIDHEGATVIAYPAGVAPVVVGTVAAVTPRGVYDNLSLPLLHTYNGTALTNVNFELKYGLATASGASQAAILARYVAQVEQNYGLVGNTADSVDYALVQNNSLILDSVTRTLYQWRNGQLNIAEVIGAQWTPKGLYNAGTTYAKNDMVQSGNYVFVSNAGGNLGNSPDTAPGSTGFWTYVPVATVAQVLAALGVNSITISQSDPSGGSDNDLWFKVPV